MLRAKKYSSERYPKRVSNISKKKHALRGKKHPAHQMQLGSKRIWQLPKELSQ